jgi:hypothetical protein
MQNGTQTDHTTILDEKLVLEDEDDEAEETESITDLKPASASDNPRSKFHINNPFKRKKVLPPEQVRAGQVIDPVGLGNSTSTSKSQSQQPAHDYRAWDLKGRMGAFAADQGERWRERKRGEEGERDLPVTIIPAQPRGRTWSPDATLDLPAAAAAAEATAAATTYPPSADGRDTFDSEGPTAVEGSPASGRGGSDVEPLLRDGSGSPSPSPPRTADDGSAARADPSGSSDISPPTDGHASPSRI